MDRVAAIATGMMFAGLGLLGLSTAGQAGQAAGPVPTAGILGQSEGPGQTGGWVMLTDGRDMNNFDQAGNAAWRVAEQAVAADAGTGFLVTKQSYDNFRLRAEFWPDEGTNSGIFIRCQNPQQPGAQTCYEINIFDSNPNRGNATGSIPGVAPVDRALTTELRWNTLEIEAKGPQLNVSVNGERTVSIRDTRHARGRIALQRNAGVIYFKNVQIQPLSADDLADQAEDIFAACNGGFGINFPAGTTPTIRDVSYTTSSGTQLPAKEYFVEKAGNRYSVTSVLFPDGPYSSRDITNHAMAELAKKGEVRTQLFVTVGLGRPGGQMNIFTPNGRQVRAAVYMGRSRLVIAQTDATIGDSEALIFEQSIVLLNNVGNDIDRVNANNAGITRKYDCRYVGNTRA
jgi:Domain of Unknown Function (DUF1080)